MVFADAVFRGLSWFRGVASLDNITTPHGLGLAGVLANGNLSLAGGREDDPVDITSATVMGGLWAVGAVVPGLTGVGESEVYGRMTVGGGEGCVILRTLWLV